MLLPPAAARARMSRVVGRLVLPYYFHMIEAQGLITALPDKRGRNVYRLEDIERVITCVQVTPFLLQELQERRIYTASEVPLVTGTLSLSRWQRYWPMYSIQPAYSLQRGNRFYYGFYREDIEMVAMRVVAQDDQQDRQMLLSTREAIAYLEQRLGIAIRPARFYQYVHRHKTLLHPIRWHHRYYFEPKELDQVFFHTPKYHRPEGFEPVKINSSYDLKALEQVYGCELVTKERLLALIRERVGYPYQADALKQRMAKHQIWPVAYDQSGARWYPVLQLDHLAFQSAPAKRWNKRT